MTGFDALAVVGGVYVACVAICGGVSLAVTVWERFRRKPSKKFQPVCHSCRVFEVQVPGQVCEMCDPVRQRQIPLVRLAYCPLCATGDRLTWITQEQGACEPCITRELAALDQGLGAP